MQTDWFATWFDSAHYYALDAHQSDAEAARFIDVLSQRGPISAPAASS